jgi:hypothetical protein
MEEQLQTFFQDLANTLNTVCTSGGGWTPDKFGHNMYKFNIVRGCRSDTVFKTCSACDSEIRTAEQNYRTMFFETIKTSAINNIYINREIINTTIKNIESTSEYNDLLFSSLVSLNTSTVIVQNYLTEFNEKCFPTS